jgi:hypothetical protein
VGAYDWTKVEAREGAGAAIMRCPDAFSLPRNPLARVQGLRPCKCAVGQRGPLSDSNGRSAKSPTHPIPHLWQRAKRTAASDLRMQNRLRFHR